MERNMTLDPNSDRWGKNKLSKKISVVIDENGNILEFTEGLLMRTTVSMTRLMVWKVTSKENK